MDSAEFILRGKSIIDKNADYLKGMQDPNWTSSGENRVHPVVTEGERKGIAEPGYLAKRLKREAPQEGEKMEDIIKDVYEHIMPGVLHWQSPHMHAYFPGSSSAPSLLGEMIEDAVGAPCFSWAASPACTELESIVMDWLAKLIGLPEVFLHSNKDGRGGGALHANTSEATFMGILAARTEAVRRYQQEHPQEEEAVINAQLVAYCSDQAHSSVEKAAHMTLLDVDEKSQTNQLRKISPKADDLGLTGPELEEMIKLDKARGLKPFFFSATLGSTGVCAFDKLEEIAKVCKEHGVWLHVDAAYAGSFFVLDEQRQLMKGIEHADSVVMNCIKGLLVHLDCSCLWVRDSRTLYRIWHDDPLLMAEEHSGAAIDFKHWNVAFSRRFRALKLWFVLRSYGVSGLKKHKEEQIALARKFRSEMEKDERFEIVFPPKDQPLIQTGLVCFRLKADPEISDEKEDRRFHELYLNRINNTGQMYLIPSEMRTKYIIRFCVTSQFTTMEHIEKDCEVLKKVATEHLKDYKPGSAEDCSGVGQVLNPYRQKFCDASFASLYRPSEVVADHSRQMSKQTEQASKVKEAVRMDMKKGVNALKQTTAKINGGSIFCGKCN